MHTRRMFLTTSTAAALFGLSSCSSEETTTPAGSDGTSGTSGAAFPVTITHAFGETTIEAKPERVATVQWANHEVPLALGIVPVGMAKATFGDDDGDGILPWVKDKLDELGGQTPVLFDETDAIDFEGVSDTTPDVILAAYSGLTQEDYDKLSQIAPTVAFPEVAWGTSLPDMTTMNSEALGMASQGDALLEDIDGQVEAALAARPALAGKNVMFGYFDPTDLSSIGFYTTTDPRAGWLESIGFATPSAVAEATAASEEFYATVSSEQADSFADVDIVVTYGDETLLTALQADPLLSQIPAVARGSFALLGATSPLAAAANPSPLATPWALEQYMDLLAGAVAKIA
ncbi:iron-siderophore ABC transporter substrate-binding protein [Kineococcus sp. TBRC 1896]|uniref:Iron-siderophore ABC transporter substrate-binding protein n=1 Tax=Kineococcus mangrovi TaxID=1660183 RepID=A0ABV4I0M6_9ACTN